jgi:catechol 2,3-dioxygenase-like lactoylglutathione lyase family enzyme
MKRLHSLLLSVVATAELIASSVALGQVALPNSRGVAMGHLHYYVQDVEANAAFWTALGGARRSGGNAVLIDFPNVVVILSQSEPREGTEGSRLNHVAFRVESLAELEARGFEMHYNEQYPGIASVFTPEGERIELFDDRDATNIGFDPAAGVPPEQSLRHNQPLQAPIVTHHVHFYLPESDVLAARDWYVQTFGAVPGKRWRYDAADLPGMNLNFSSTDATLAPTRGRMLDHIGLEIVGLEAFCKALEARGVVFDRPYTKLPTGLALAFLTDPWGTYIELTEGLRPAD